MDGSIGEDWTVTTNLIPLVMKAVLGRSGPIQVFGTDYQTVDGSAIRDYVHVIDLADTHIRALDYLNLGGDSTAVDLGHGRSDRRSLRSLLRPNGSWGGRFPTN